MSIAPLDRIADAFVDHQALDAGVRALTAYDAFLAILDDRQQRSKLEELGADGARDSPVFTRVAELGKKFAGLLSLLFDDPELRRWVREYIVF